MDIDILRQNNDKEIFPLRLKFSGAPPIQSLNAVEIRGVTNGLTANLNV
jgi:hypothetical protein